MRQGGRDSQKTEEEEEITFATVGARGGVDDCKTIKWLEKRP